MKSKLVLQRSDKFVTLMEINWKRFFCLTLEIFSTGSTSLLIGSYETEAAWHAFFEIVAKTTDVICPLSVPFIPPTRLRAKLNCNPVGKREFSHPVNQARMNDSRDAE